MDRIIADAERETAAVRAEYVHTITSAQEEIDRLQVRIKRARESVSEAKSAMDRAFADLSVPATPAELLPRSATEAALAEADIRGIRYRDREERYRSLAELVEKVREELRDCEEREATRSSGLVQNREQARSRVEGIYARCRQRIQDYWQGVSDGHRDGPALSVLLTDSHLPKAPDVGGW